MSSKGEKKPDKGLSFPTENGERSTTTTGKKIIAAAIRGSQAPGCDDLANKCEKEKNWRFKYNKHYMNMVKVSAYSPEAAIGVAKAGIEYMHANFEFVDPKNTSSVVKFSQYMQGTFTPFQTGMISGSKSNEAKPTVSVPYKGGVLRGNDLKAQLNAWAKYGTIEADAAQAIASLADKPLDLTGKYFVLIGAGSAMGPFIKLLEHGATVVAIDIPGSWNAKLWERLITTAKNSPGSIIFPLAKPQAQYANDAEMFAGCGCNLTEQPGEILAWLKTVAVGAGANGMTVGNYTYLDGDLHVKLSLAADAILSGLTAAYKETKIAFLCTPTDIHFVPDDAHKAALKHYSYHPGKLIESFINLVTMGSKLRKNALAPIITADQTKVKVIDGLSVAQGPNYALAKRLQHWRATVSYKAGHVVSSNIAPSTATLSVVSNKTFAWAYGGMPYFKPYEIFQQDTTNALMCAILVFDVTDKNSAANPASKTVTIKNPLELFKYNSLHGGVWRAGYQVDSIGEVSALIYFMGGPAAFLPVTYCILAVIGLLIAKLMM